MRLTGHPLVDTGLAIAALYCKKHSVSELNETDLRRAVEYLDKQIDPSKTKPGPLNKLKVLSVFWQNNPLAGHNMGKDGANVYDYRQALRSKINGGKNENHGYCQICGNQAILRNVNRSWLPLGASSDGDPCSLPNLSGKFICVSCFSAIILLPLGCKFVGSNPYLYHLSDPTFICRAAEDGFKAVQSQLAANATGNENLKTAVKLSGRIALLEIVSGSYLWDANYGGMLTKHLPMGATIIAFSNAGTSAAWYQLHLPAQVLIFFAEIDSAEQFSKGLLRATFLSWARICEKPEYADKNTKQKRTNPYFEMLCENIEQRRSLAPLVRAIVLQRVETHQILKQEERQVLEMYERFALNKEDRFKVLNCIAEKIKNLAEPHRGSFIKQLANIRSRTTLLDLIRKYTHFEKTSLRLNHMELRVLEMDNAGEIISLLYLLIMAEE